MAMERTWILLSKGGRGLIVAAAVAFLLLGFALRPSVPTSSRQEEAPGALLQEAVQQQEDRTLSRVLQDVGESTVRYAARISGRISRPDVWSDWQPHLRMPETREYYGVLVAPGEVLAYGLGLSDDPEVQVQFNDGPAVGGSITSRFLASGLIQIVADGASDRQPPRIAAGGGTAGDAVVATAPGLEGPIIAPLFLSSSGTSISATTTPLDDFRGLPVFSSERELLGIVGDVEGKARIISVDAAMIPSPTPAAIPRRIGLSLGSRTEPTDGPPGVIVIAVEPDGLAARVGILADDLLLQIDEEIVVDVAQAASTLTSPDAPDLRLNIRRGLSGVTLLTVTIPGAERIEP
jgi:hypothetical protein